MPCGGLWRVGWMGSSSMIATAAARLFVAAVAGAERDAVTRTSEAPGNRQPQARPWNRPDLGER
jgi:hypothetical protein